MTHAFSLHPARISAMALLGAGALAGVGCRSAEPVAGAAPATMVANAAAPAATPVAVNCGPGLQALIRPSVVAGQAISQVDCVPVTGAAAAYGTAYAVPSAAMATLDGDPRIAAPVYREVVRPAYRPVQYQRAPVRHVQRGRSVKKSALIIGSSAGIGAGVGAAVKGKKGALIGAAIGGGAATVWDQITRRDRN